MTADNPHHKFGFLTSKKVATTMPQNTKDNNGGKNHPVKDTAASGAKRVVKGSADNKPNSPGGSQNKGEKKTTP